MLKRPRITDKRYTAWFKHLPCCYRGIHTPCYGDVIGAHLRLGGNGGAGLKPVEYYGAGEICLDRVFPLCFGCHHLQHVKGELWFHGGRLPEVQKLIRALGWIYIEHSEGLHTSGTKAARKEIKDFMFKIRGRGVKQSGLD